MPPYLPFLEALGQYIQDASEKLPHMQDAATFQALASLFPGLTTQQGKLPALSSSPPEQARFRLYEAIGIFLQNVAASHILVLIFDDLHWADSASLDLLSHVMRRQQDARLLVLGAYRNSEINQNSALVSSIAELSRQRTLTTIATGPLSCAEIETLAEHALGDPLSPDESSLLYTLSEGNPFFAEELLQFWIERKSLSYKQGGWTIETTLDQTLPQSIIGILRQRFAQFSPDCIDHLRVAAIIGDNFDLALLAAVKENRIEWVEERLLEAVRGCLVRIEKDGTFTFSHDYIRTCLFAEVSISRSQILHAKISAVLEALDMAAGTQQITEPRASA